MKKSIPLFSLLLALGMFTAGPIVTQHGLLAAGVAHADGTDGGGAGSENGSDGSAGSHDGSDDSAGSNGGADDNGNDDDVTGIDNPDEADTTATTGTTRSVRCNFVGCA
jgi:hypothetical protein